MMHPQVVKILKLDEGSPAQRTDGWYKLRKDRLTASAVASAIGVNPYESPEKLITVKCGEGTFTGNAATEWGNKYEDEARIKYEEMFDEKVHEVGLLPHPTIDYLAGSPDGVTSSGRLIEIKCPLRREIKDEIPSYYMPQVQLLMEILDLEVCDFIQYKPSELTWPRDPEFNVVSVERDREWFAENLPIMRNFWDRVLWHRIHGTEGLIKRRKKKESIAKIPVVEKKKEEECEL